MPQKTLKNKIAIHDFCYRASMLPDEIMNYCDGAEVLKESIYARIPNCLYYADNETEEIMTDSKLINEIIATIGNQPLVQSR